MKLSRLRLVNYCQHGDREVRFSPRLTGIVGPNGSGKSNMLAGLRLALTGVDQNAGKLDDNISQRMPAGEKSFVEAEFAGHNYSAVVRKQLSPKAKPLLTINAAGAPSPMSLRGDANVTSKLVELLGANEATLNEYVLISQGKLFAFLDKQPAKRAEAFQELFQLGRYAAAFAATQQHATIVQREVVQQPTAVLELQITDMSTRRAMQWAEFQTLPDDPDLDRWRGEVTMQLAAYDMQRREVSEIQLLVTQIATAEQQLAAWQQQRDQVTKSRDEWAAYCQQMQPHVAQLREMVAAFDQHQRVAGLRSELQATQVRLEQELSLLVVPAPPSSVPLDTLKSQLTEVVRQRLAMEKLLQTFMTTGLVECPTCQTPVANLQHKIAEANQLLPGLASEHANLVRVTRDQEAYERAAANTAAQRVSKAEAIARTATQLQSLGPAAAVVDATQAREQLKQFDDGTAVVQRANSELSTYVHQMSTASANLEHARAKLAALQAKQAAMLDEQSVAAIRQQLQHREAVASNRKQLITQLNMLDVEIAKQQANLRQLLATAAASDTAQQWLNRVLLLQQYVHRDSLPKQLMLYRLSQLQDSTNELLRLFGADFTVQADDSLSFTATFRSGTVSPAHRLSYGQKTVLAVGFCAAVNSMFAGDVGLLVMDEPTAYLDEPYIEQFADVIRKLRELSDARGLQVVMITHERSLIPLFDEVIEL